MPPKEQATKSNDPAFTDMSLEEFDKRLDEVFSIFNAKEVDDLKLLSTVEAYFKNELEFKMFVLAAVKDEKKTRRTLLARELFVK